MIKGCCYHDLNTHSSMDSGMVVYTNDDGRIQFDIIGEYYNVFEDVKFCPYCGKRLEPE